MNTEIKTKLKKFGIEWLCENNEFIALAYRLGRESMQKEILEKISKLHPKQETAYTRWSCHE